MNPHDKMIKEVRRDGYTKGFVIGAFLMFCLALWYIVWVLLPVIN